MRDGIDNTLVSSSVMVVRPEFLAYMDFSGSAPVRIWTGNKDTTFTDFSGSAVYTAIGTLGKISSVSETSDTSAKGIELSLSGIPSAYISLALTNNYRGRTVAIYMILYNESRTTYQQTMIWRGRMDQMIINEGETTSTITVKCENRLADFNRVREIRYTDEYQKSIYPTDTGLEFITGMADKMIYWGTSAPTTTIATPGGGGGGGGEDGTIITPP